MTDEQRTAVRAAFLAGGSYTEGDPHGGHKLDWSWDAERETFTLRRQDAYSDAEDIEDLDEERFWRMIESVPWKYLAPQLGLD